MKLQHVIFYLLSTSYLFSGSNNDLYYEGYSDHSSTAATAFCTIVIIAYFIHLFTRSND